MYIFVTILIFIVCILLVLLVLVQNSKGGGLTSSFSSSNQVMGVRKTTDFLEKATWYLIGLLFVLSVLSSAFIPRQGEFQRSAIEDQIREADDPSEVPLFPQSVPEESSTGTGNGN